MHTSMASFITTSSFASMLARTLFASTLRRTSCNTKPQRGVTRVASRFNGWYIAARKKRAFRYATSNPCRVPKGTLSVNILITSH